MAGRIDVMLSHLSPEMLEDPLDYMGLKDLIPTQLNFARLELRQKLEIPYGQYSVLNNLSEYLSSGSCLETGLCMYELGMKYSELAEDYTNRTLKLASTLSLSGFSKGNLINYKDIISFNKTVAISLELASTKIISTPYKEKGFILNGRVKNIPKVAESSTIILFAKDICSNEVHGFLIETDSGVTITDDSSVCLRNVFVPVQNRLEINAEEEISNSFRIEKMEFMCNWIDLGHMARLYEQLSKQESIEFKDYSLKVLNHFHAAFLALWKTSILIDNDLFTPVHGILVKSLISAIQKDIHSSADEFYRNHLI